MDNYFDQFDSPEDGGEGLGVEAAVNLPKGLGSRLALPETDEQKALQAVEDTPYSKDAIEQARIPQAGPKFSPLEEYVQEVAIPEYNVRNLEAYVGSLKEARKKDPRKLKNDIEIGSFIAPFFRALISGVAGGTGHFLDTTGVGVRRSEQAKKDAELRAKGVVVPFDIRRDKILSLNDDVDISREHPVEVVGKLIVQMTDEVLDAQAKLPVMQSPEVWEEFRKDKYWTDLANYTLSKAGSGTGSAIVAIAGAVIGKKVAGTSGAAVGALSGSFFMNLGDVRDTLKKSGITSEAELQKWTVIGTSVLGSLDALTPFALTQVFSPNFKRVLGKEVLSRLVRTGVASGVTEGVTEALQEGFLMGIAAEASGNEKAMKDFFVKIREAGVGGFITGLFLGAGTGAVSGLQDRANRPTGLTVEIPDGPAKRGGVGGVGGPQPGEGGPGEGVQETPNVKEEVKQGVKEGVQETANEATQNTVNAAAEAARAAGVPETIITPIQRSVQEGLNPAQQENTGLNEDAEISQTPEELVNTFTPSERHLTIAIRQQGVANARAILDNATTIEEVRAIAEQSALRIPDSTTDINLAKEQALQSAVGYINKRHVAGSTGQSLQKRYSGIAADPGGFEYIASTTPEQRLSERATVNKQPLDLSTINRTDNLPTNISQLNEEYNVARLDETYDINSPKERSEHSKKVSAARQKLSEAILEHNTEIAQQESQAETTDPSARDQSRGRTDRIDPSDAGNINLDFIPGLEPAENNLRSVLVQLAKALGVPIRNGRLHSKGALGEVTRNVNVIRHSIPNDLVTIAHEGGHTIHNKDTKNIDAIVAAHKPELVAYYQSLHGSVVQGDLGREAFAEFFSTYITNPSMAQREMPGTFQAFEDHLSDNNAELLADLKAVQDGVNKWENAPSAGRMASSVVYKTKNGKFADEPSEGAKLVDDFPGRIGHWADKAYTATVDKHHPMYRATQILKVVAAENTGVDPKKIHLKAVNDPYKVSRMTPRAYQTGHMAIMHGVTPWQDIDPQGASIRDAMVHAMGGTETNAWNQDAIQAFDQYIISKRMILKWDDKIAGIIPNAPDKDNQDVHRNTVAQYEASNPQFVQAAEMVYEYNRNMLALKRDAGLITKEQYDELIQEADYVPLMRDMRSVEELSNAVGKAKRGKKKLKNKVIHRFLGSNRDVLSPLQSIVMDTYETHMMIMRNETVKTLHRLSLHSGPGGGAIAEQIPATQIVGAEVTVEEVLRQAAKTAGLGTYETEGLVMSISDRIGDDATSTIWRPAAINEKGERIVYYRDEGEVVAIRLADDELGQQLFELVDFLGPEQSGFIIQAMGGVATALRSGITTHPEFMFANYLRDQISAWVLTEDFTPFATSLTGAYSELTQNEISRRMNAFGVIMGGAQVSAFDDVRIKNDLNALRIKGIKAPKEWTPRSFFGVTEFSETATRAGVFQRAYQRHLDEGLTPYEAAREAAFDANDYMPFDLNGSKSEAVKRVVPFFNAAVQGMNVAGKTAIGRRDSVTNIKELITPFVKDQNGAVLSIAEQKELPNSRRFYMKLLAVGAAGLALAMLNSDDDEIDEKSDYLKATHWFIRINGEIYRYPKPFELAIASNAFEAAWDYAYKDDPTAPYRYLKATLEHTVIPPTDPAVLTIWRMKYNYDPFRKRAIVPEYLKRKAVGERYDAGTSELGKLYGKVMGDVPLVGMSPLMFDYMVRGFGGAWGRDLLQASNLVDTNRPAYHWADYFIARRFTHRHPKGARSIEKFWKIIANVNGEYTGSANSYKGYVQSGIQGDLLRANDMLSSMNDGEKAYALLNTYHKTDQKRLHPFRRARDIVGIASNMRKEMQLGHLKTGRQETLKVLDPYDKRDAAAFLSDIQLREVRNSLVLEGVTGWAQKKYLDVDGVEKEFKAKYPAVYKEFKRRHRSKRGRVIVKDFESVKKHWPEMKKRLLRDGTKASLLGYR